MILQRKFVLFIRNDTTIIMIICNWFKRFRTGNFDLKDEGRSGYQQ